MLYAIRHDHKSAGRGNPLQDRPLLAITLKGLKRIKGGSWRKVACAIDIVRGACADLDLEELDDFMLCLAMVLM